MSLRSLIASVVLACAVASANTFPVHASEGGGAAAVLSGPAVVRIRPLMLPVINSKGAIEKYNQVEVTLEISNSQNLEEAQSNLPRLQDTILAEFYKAIDAGWIVRGNIANATALRKRLLEVCSEVLGKGLVGRVLIAPMSRQSSWP